MCIALTVTVQLEFFNCKNDHDHFEDHIFKKMTVRGAGDFHATIFSKNKIFDMSWDFQKFKLIPSRFSGCIVISIISNLHSKVFDNCFTVKSNCIIIYHM